MEKREYETFLYSFRVYFALPSIALIINDVQR